jgi:hypothetical protein
MTTERRMVTLSKSQRETTVGRELIELLVQLSVDGAVSREELELLRKWLEADHAVDCPALPFLYETIEQISSDGEISEDDLDRLALAIERVLPKVIRVAAAARRKEARNARRIAQREDQRQAMIAERTERRAARDVARTRQGILYQANFPIAGAFRSEERRDACERLIVDDIVTFEREPDNIHDANAILILGGDECELGYVRREEAGDIAPLLDAGAEADVRVHRLWETPDGNVVPIVLVEVRQGDNDGSIVQPRSQRELTTSAQDSGTSPPGPVRRPLPPARSAQRPSPPPPGKRAGLGAIAVGILLLLLVLTLLAAYFG